MCAQLTDYAIRKAIVALPYLTSIDLRGCKSIRDTCLQQIAESCPRVKKLWIAQCGLLSDNGILQLASRCSHIESLDASNCAALTDDSMTALVSANPCSDIYTDCLLYSYCIISSNRRGLKLDGNHKPHNPGLGEPLPRACVSEAELLQRLDSRGERVTCCIDHMGLPPYRL